MKRILAAAGILLVSAIGPPGASAADGCPAGTVRTTPVTGDTFTTFFDAFVVGAGETSTCNLLVSTGVAHDADTFMVYSADYRGVMTVTNGESGLLSVVHNGVTDQKLYVGPYDDDLNFRNYLSTDTAGILFSSIAIDLTDATDALSGAALDTIDYALAATTTRGAIEASLDELSEARTAAVLHLQSTSDLLAGVNRPLVSPDQIALVGGLGSHFLGITGRRTVSSDFTVEGGAALFDQSAGGAAASGVLFSGSVRYLPLSSDPLRPFAEIGLRAASMRLNFTRHYDDGSADGATAASSTDGLFAGAYAEAGILYVPDPDNQLVVSATLMHSWLGTDGNSENFSESNLFSASIEGDDAKFDTVKLSTAWTSLITQNVDLTLNGGLGHIFANNDLDADIVFVGSVEGAASDDDFIEYGARLGFKPTSTFNADLFLQGATGVSSGTHALAGVSVRRQF